jgi:hypothetical protein
MDKTFDPFPFIVGAGRSGTTLLRLMLDSHTQLSIPAETGFLMELSNLTPGADSNTIIQTMINHPCWPDLSVSAADFKEKAQSILPFELSEAIRTFYSTYARQHGKTRYGDKTPGYCLFIDKIQDIIPEARFIHIIRDGRDVALSIRPLWFSPSDQIEGLAADWCMRIKKTRELSRQCRHYMEIKYESLIMQPEVELRRILDFIDLPYENQMMDYYLHAPTRLTEVKDRYILNGSRLITQADRINAQRKTFQKPVKDNIFRWRTLMTPDEICRYQQVAADTLLELGYELAYS